MISDFCHKVVVTISGFYCTRFGRASNSPNHHVQIANLFENNSSSEWLLYISEWTQGNLGLSNLRVTTKVAVQALLGDTPALADYGTAIMHNLGTREVTAVVRV